MRKGGGVRSDVVAAPAKIRVGGAQEGGAREGMGEGREDHTSVCGIESCAMLVRAARVC